MAKLVNIGDIYFDPNEDEIILNLIDRKNFPPQTPPIYNIKHFLDSLVLYKYNTRSLRSDTARKETGRAETPFLGNFKIKTAVETLSEKIRSSFKSPSPEKELKPLPKIRVNPIIRDVLDFWEMAGFHLPKDTTILYRETIITIRQLLNGGLFNEKEYSPGDVKASIMNFRLAAFDPGYRPASQTRKEKLRKMELKDFIYSRFIKVENNSLFLHYLKNHPITAVPEIKIVDQEVFQLLKNWYLRKIIGNPNASLTDYQKHHISKGSNIIHSFFWANSNLLKPAFRDTFAFTVFLMAELLNKLNDESKFQIYWFSSKFFEEQLIPEMLAKKFGMFKNSNNIPYYQRD